MLVNDRDNWLRNGLPSLIFSIEVASAVSGFDIATLLLLDGRSVAGCIEHKVEESVALHNSQDTHKKRAALVCAGHLNRNQESSSVRSKASLNLWLRGSLRYAALSTSPAIASGTGPDVARAR